MLQGPVGRGSPKGSSVRRTNSGDKKQKNARFRRWFVRALMLLFSLVLILPALFYLFMLLESARSGPSDPARSKRRGKELLKIRSKTVAVVVAHPDDVDYWASGTLARLHRNGNQIILIVGTSGEKGADISDIGNIREAEQEKAGRIVGYDKIVFLRHPDRSLKANEEFKDELRRIFTLHRPDILFTFDIEKEDRTYHHPDHQAAGAASRAVASEFGSIRTIYQFHSCAPDVIIETGKVAAIKRRALDAHDSVLGRSEGWRRALTVFYAIEKRIVVNSPEYFRAIKNKVE